MKKKKEKIYSAGVSHMPHVRQTILLYLIAPYTVHNLYNSELNVLCSVAPLFRSVSPLLSTLSQPTVYMFKKISTLFSIGVQYGGDSNQYYAKTIGKTSYKNIKKETELKMKIIYFLFISIVFLQKAKLRF